MNKMPQLLFCCALLFFCSAAKTPPDYRLEKGIYLFQNRNYVEARKTLRKVIRDTRNARSIRELYLYVSALWYDAKCAKILGQTDEAQRNCQEFMLAVKFCEKHKDFYQNMQFISGINEDKLRDLEREIEDMRKDVHEQAPDFWEDLLNGNFGTAIRKARKWDKDDRELAKKEAELNRKKNSK